MTKLILYALIIWGLVKLWRFLHPKLEVPRAKQAVDGSRIDGGELVQDPQCGVYVPKATALRGRDGTPYCSESCREAHERKGS